MSQPLNFAKPTRTVHVGVILTGGVTEILDVAPIDLIGGVSKGKGTLAEMPDEMVPPALKAEAIDTQFHWITEEGKPASLTCGVKIEATDSFATCPPLDIALMGAHNFDYKTKEVELAFIRKVYGDCTAFISICGGFVPLLEAGLLEGKKATAPRILLKSLQQDAPGTEWLEKRWVRDGKIWTSGALLNGTDLMRAFGTEFWGARKDSIMGVALDLGAWPIRNVDYQDA